MLHDMFGVPFDEIAPIVGRSAEAARQLASRARRRVRGTAAPDPDLSRQQQIVEAFLAAAREGNFEGLLALLDPDVVARADRALLPILGTSELRGAEAVAKRTIRGGARAAQAALVDGAVGVVIAPRGRLLMVLRFTVQDGRIAEIEAVGEPERLRQLELAALTPPAENPDR